MKEARQKVKAALALARAKVECALRDALSPVVLSSFGKDSMLLLALALEVRPDIPVLWLRSDLTPEQRRFAEDIIRAWDLTVYGYAPADRYLIANDDEDGEPGLTLVNEYSVGEERLPVLVDIKASETGRCALTLSRAGTPRLYQAWDVMLVGWKESDVHAATGPNPFPPDGYELGGASLYAPLRHLTDADVWRATYRMGLPYNVQRYDRKNSAFDPDTLTACTNCLMGGGGGRVYCPDEAREIAAHAWDGGAGALDNFRQRYGFNSRSQS